MTWTSVQREVVYDEPFPGILLETVYITMYADDSQTTAQLMVVYQRGSYEGGGCYEFDGEGKPFQEAEEYDACYNLMWQAAGNDLGFPPW
jgi:hypothetical protein